MFRRAWDSLKPAREAMSSRTVLGVLHSKWFPAWQFPHETVDAFDGANSEYRCACPEFLDHSTRLDVPLYGLTHSTPSNHMESPVVVEGLCLHHLGGIYRNWITILQA